MEGVSGTSSGAAMPAEAAIRLACFVGVLVTMASWEAVAPRRQRYVGGLARRAANLTLSLVNIGAARVLMPLSAAAVAASAESAGFGLLHLLPAPIAVEFVLAFVVLDGAIYAQHVLTHRVPLLWRLHAVHHADPEFDVTTGLRFHTLEILLSAVYKAAWVALLGPPVLAVLAFEIALNGCAMFNHSNVRLPIAVDRWLRWVIVTPDMHRVHHSVDHDEMNRNFGFNLPCWDWLFGTYRAQPRAGHEEMAIGLHDVDPTAAIPLHRLWLLPFRPKNTAVDEG